MTFEELREILKDSDKEPLTSFTLEDYDGNTIESSDLYILDAYAMREWQVREIQVLDRGHLHIVLNSGNFKEHGFRNVF